jgi:hypothetical protein
VFCKMCHKTPASRREDYAFGALCDECSRAYMSWPCPDCGEVRHGIRMHAGAPCWTCGLERIWAPLSQPVRDEIDRAIAEQPNITAFVRIRELTGCDLQQAMRLHSHRHSLMP